MSAFAYILLGLVTVVFVGGFLLVLHDGPSL